MKTPIFYLSKDKAYLMDEQDRNIYSLVEDADHAYYKPITIESEAIEKICISSISISVCSLWSDTHKCLDFTQVEVCTQWKLIPKGFSNIS